MRKSRNISGKLDNISAETVPSGRPQYVGHLEPWHREAQKLIKRRVLRAQRTPQIYFFKCNEFVKIGWTTDPNSRLAACQVMSPYLIEQVGLMVGGEEEERGLHKAFKDLRRRAEWFQIAPPLSEMLEVIKDKPIYRARDAAGEWFFARFSKTGLRLPPELECKRRRYTCHTYRLQVAYDE